MYVCIILESTENLKILVLQNGQDEILLRAVIAFEKKHAEMGIS